MTLAQVLCAAAMMVAHASGQFSSCTVRESRQKELFPQLDPRTRPRTPHSSASLRRVVERESSAHFINIRFVREGAPDRARGLAVTLSSRQEPEDQFFTPATTHFPHLFKTFIIFPSPACRVAGCAGGQPRWIVHVRLFDAPEIAVRKRRAAVSSPTYTPFRLHSSPQVEWNCHVAFDASLCFHSLLLNDI
jgi:hypothetical protein